jgi:diguanylate cyclase (GGDEF)-like protein
MFAAEKNTQSTRLVRRYGSSALTSLMFVCLLWMAYRFGFLGVHQFFIASGATLACIVTFYLLIHSGWNEKRKDPSLSLPMMLASISVNTYVVYSVQSARGAFLLVYLVSMLFGVFHLSMRQMLRVAVFILLLYGWVIWQLAAQGLAKEELNQELLQWTMLMFVVVWFSIMVGFISTLMTRLGQSEFDDLTGAYTRRRVTEILRHEKFRADRGAGPLCVCLLDIDNLKQINDTRGHQSGDLQLKTVVSAVQRELRNIDYIGRYGGDEFLVVLTQTPLAGARDCAERFRRTLKTYLFSSEKDTDVTATISIGIAEYRSGESISQTVNRADAALYRAKEGGRNKIECAPMDSNEQFAV